MVKTRNFLAVQNNAALQFLQKTFQTDAWHDQEGEQGKKSLKLLFAMVLVGQIGSKSVHTNLMNNDDNIR